MLPCFARRLPSKISNLFFGDRDRWGVHPPADDADWLAWEKLSAEIYDKTQRTGVGRTVNDAGYAVLSAISLKGKTVLEIGPGYLPHKSFWQGKPDLYYLVDRREKMLEESASLLQQDGVAFSKHLVDGASSALPFDDSSVDILLSFYSFEHLYPFENFIEEYCRVLRPGGLIVGAIPAEGGLAWGAGRTLTTRRVIRDRYGIDNDKIICWEHPNFADDVIAALDRKFSRELLAFWPLYVPVPDMNLVIKFVYRVCKDK